MTIIFVLSIVVLILIFVLFSRDQGAKTVEKTLANLATTNQELQKSQQKEAIKPLADRLKDASVDPNNVWMMADGCKEPYCLFIKIATDGKEPAVATTRGLARWKGRYEDYKDKGGAACDAFILEDNTVHAIDMSLLASLEQKLLKQSTNQDPTQVSVYVRENDKPEDPCHNPAVVMNVHFE